MEKQTQQQFAENMLQYVNDSPTAYHAVENAEEMLKRHDFQELKETEAWSLHKGGRYFVVKNNSCILAFTAGDGDLAKEGFRLIGAHTDSPALKIKPGDCTVTADGYVKLNVEVYGGAILSTWFDRPLALAGRVIVKEDGRLTERLIKIDKPVCVIPNLCIHFNKDCNTSNGYNKQTDILPLLSMKEEGVEKGDYLFRLIQKETGIGKADILDYELFLYEYQKGIFMGQNEEFISASRIDNLSMVYAGLSALTEAGDSGNKYKVFAAFDNEEVGSISAPGARSGFLAYTLERICKNLGLTEDAYFQALANSTSISADTAHAVHPNYSDKHDPENRPVPGAGPVIKYSASQRYSTNAFSASYFIEACRKAKVPYQKYVNRNDIIGGSTIGPALSGLTTIPTVDIGTPVLAMHSIREFCAVADNFYTKEAFRAYYEDNGGNHLCSEF